MENASALKKLLEKEYKYRIELHAHTSPVSHCGHKSPEEQVELYKKAGFDGIVIINHFLRYPSENGEEYLKGCDKKERLDFYCEGYERAKNHGDKLGVAVYFGAELRFDDSPNDYLLFGVDRKILEKVYDLLPYGIKYFRKELDLPDSVLIWAHPGRNGMVPCDTHLVDGIETFNMHPGHNGRIGIAARLANEAQVNIKTCGSDCHNDVDGVVGASALRTKTLPQDSFELAKLLKENDYIFEIGGTSIVLP